MADDVRDIPPAIPAEDWDQPNVRLHDDFRIVLVADRSDPKGRRRYVMVTRGQLDVAPTEDGVSITVGPHNGAVVTDVSQLAAIIAIANAATNDEDPRKLTRAHVDALREAVERWGSESIAGYEEPGGIGVSGDNQELDAEARQIDLLSDLANVIESFLPPRRIDVIEKLVRE